MNISLISKEYKVRQLNKEDVGIIYALELDNPMYFKFCPPEVTKESVLDDLKALPPNMTYDDKYYIGFFLNNKLIAVMDLILHYPNKETAFIGFFMMNKKYQGKGIGSSIIDEVLMFLKEKGFSYVRLGYMKGNEQSKHFWLKNDFIPTGIEANNKQGIVVVLQKQL